MNVSSGAVKKKQWSFFCELLQHGFHGLGRGLGRDLGLSFGPGGMERGMERVQYPHTRTEMLKGVKCGVTSDTHHNRGDDGLGHAAAGARHRGGTECGAAV